MRKLKNANGITLIALVVTIVVLLILAGVSINAVFGQDGIIQRAKDAQNKMDQATQNDLDGLNDLDKLISSLTDKTTGDADPKMTITMFDTGENVKAKINSLIPEGIIDIESVYIFNVAVDSIEKYNSTPDLTKITDANIVSLKESKFPIYMWFEKSGTTETRNVVSSGPLAEAFKALAKEVETGTIYWWSESEDVYLNPDSSQMFATFSYLENIDGLSNMKTNYTTDMSSMLYFADRLKDANALMNWDTSKVTNMSNMFLGNTNLINITALANWNTSNVTNMSYMFKENLKLTNIDALANWNTSNVTNMEGMFTNELESKENIINLDALANWDTSNVTDMSYMFSGNINLTNIDALKNWDTSKVASMRYMFGHLDTDGCGITNLSAISNWDVSNVTNMSQMFYGCKKLEDASAISNWKTTAFDSQMFYNCPNLKNITIPNTVIKIESEVFFGCSNLAKVKILATDANKFEVDSRDSGVFNDLASNSKIYVLSEEIKAKLEGSYNTSKTTVEVVTLDQMNNL